MQTLEGVRDTLQEAHDDDDIEDCDQVVFKTPDGQVFELGQYNYDININVLIVDLKPSTVSR